MTKQDFLAELSGIVQLPAGMRLQEDTVIADYWDSLAQIGVLAMLDKEFAVTLSMDELTTIRTVGDVMGLVRNKGGVFDT